MLHVSVVFYIMVRLDSAVQGAFTLQEVVWGAAGHMRLPSARRRVKLQAEGREGERDREGEMDQFSWTFYYFITGSYSTQPLQKALAVSSFSSVSLSPLGGPCKHTEPHLPLLKRQHLREQGKLLGPVVILATQLEEVILIVTNRN